MEMDHIRVYIPVNRESTPQYKLGNAFYNAITLQAEPEKPHDKAFSLHLTVLESKPLLVYIRNGGWVLFDSQLRSPTDSRLLGRSSEEDQNDVPVKLLELTIPTSQVLSNGGLIPQPKRSFSENNKRQFERVIERGEELRLSNVRFSNISREIAVPIYVAPQSIVPIRVEAQQQLEQLSYETLVKQLYGLPVVLPEFLIVNDLKLKFIPFSQLSTIQIEKYIIEPLLQPWAGPPNTQNRILTIFGKNGLTYLVKALYDQASGRIFPPI